MTFLKSDIRPVLTFALALFCALGAGARARGWVSYVDIPDEHVYSNAWPINPPGVYQWETYEDEYWVDFNGDGSGEIKFWAWVHFAGGQPCYELSVDDNVGSRIAINQVNTTGSSTYGGPKGFTAGEPIGPDSWFEDVDFYFFFSSYPGIDFVPANLNGGSYMGVEFEVDGAIHYGWIRYEIVNEFDSYTTAFYDDREFKIFEYAWQTTPNTPIAAGATPEPATMMLLGLGAAAGMRRRRCTAGVPPAK